MFEVFQSQQSEIEKVAGTTGRIENAEGAQAVKETTVVVLCFLTGLCPHTRRFRCLRRFQGPLNGSFLGFPFGHQRPHYHGVDDKVDLVPIRVEAAQLAALGGVKSTFEQRSENGRVDFRPIQPSGRQHFGYIFLFKRQRFVIVKQAAVKPFDVLEADKAAATHRREQHARHVLEGRGVGLGSFQHPLEHLVRQKVDVFRKHREDKPVDEVGNPLRVMAALA